MLSTKQKESLGILFVIANKARLVYLRWKYRGDKVYCACCESKFRSFATFGNIRRKNAWCPKCESLERHRLLSMYFKNKTDIYRKHLKVLHIAPEGAFFNHLKKQKNLEYNPVDIYPHLYPKGTTYLDILNNDIADNTYDIIICNHVFQYIEDDRKAMKELQRMMKKGGWGTMQVPYDRGRQVTYEDASITHPLEREKAFGLKEHVRFYGLDYSDRLRDAGFDVNVEDYTSEFSDEENFKYGFWKGDPIFLVKKLNSLVAIFSIMQ
ncbi:MAG: methyltransferase domain-containing protein [Ginsengibacter sp.]